MSSLLDVWSLGIIFYPSFVEFVLESVGKSFGMRVFKAADENLLARFTWK